MAGVSLCLNPAAVIVPTAAQVARFVTKTAVEGDHLIWTGAAVGVGNQSGRQRYGLFRLAPNSHPAPTTIRAHRFAYLAWVGQIEPGNVLDHLCGIGLCVTPDHLEQVTYGENVARRNRAWADVTCTF